MPRLYFLSFALLAAACAPDRPDRNTSVDINAAALQAQGAVDAYGANAASDADGARANAEAPHSAPDRASNVTSAEPTLAPLNPPAPGTPGGLPDDRTPLSEAPFTPDSAQGAATVVQTYYALIEEGKYAEAFALREHGAGEPKTVEAFAADFARYSEYHANVGGPGAIDAGAGQRFVTVPVQIYARVKATKAPFYKIGTVTLHRSVVEGSIAASNLWRIRTIALDTAPGR